jgi:hypothetical protein
MKDLSKYRDLSMIALIVVLIIFLFRSCGIAEEQALEITRLEHNMKAQNDTMTSYITRNGNMAAEITAFKLDLKKDHEVISRMTEGYEELKGKLVGIAKGGASVITEREIPVFLKEYTDSTGMVHLEDSIIYNSTNFTKFAADAPFTIDNGKLRMDKASYKSQVSMDLLIRFQEEKGDLKVIAETQHKDVKFTSLTGGIVTQQDLPPSMQMAMRKEWGLGFSAGMGPVYNAVNRSVGPGVFLGVSINYTPKKLQVGK